MISNHGKLNGKFKIVGNNFLDLIQYKPLSLSEKIKDINSNIHLRRKIAKMYKKNLSYKISHQLSSNIEDHVYNYYSILTEDRKK